MFVLPWTLSCSHAVCFKGELKAEISNFSNIFFAKSNISEVNFVKLFSLVYCFLRENYDRSWIFPAFATSSLWAQKLNQQPAVTYDMGNDLEERFRNQEKQGKQRKQADAFLWGVLACLPHIIRDRALKRLDVRSMSQAFTRSRYSIVKMADDESKMNTSLENPQDR